MVKPGPLCFGQHVFGGLQLLRGGNLSPTTAPVLLPTSRGTRLQDAVTVAATEGGTTRCRFGRSRRHGFCRPALELLETLVLCETSTTSPTLRDQRQCLRNAPARCHGRHTVLKTETLLRIYLARVLSSCMNLYLYICICMYMDIYRYIYMYIDVHAQVSTSVCGACLSVCIYAFMLVRVYVRMHSCMYACL